MEWDYTAVEDDSKFHTSTGVVGLRAESVAAKNVVDQTVSRDPAIQKDSQLGAALESLRNIVARTQLDATGPPRNLPVARYAADARPPGWEQVRAVLKRISSSSIISSNWFSPDLLDDFCRKCNSMYEHAQEGSPT